MNIKQKMKISYIKTISKTRNNFILCNNKIKLNFEFNFLYKISKIVIYYIYISLLINIFLIVFYCFIINIFKTYNFINNFLIRFFLF